jgi:Nucleotidyltransferase domain
LIGQKTALALQRVMLRTARSPLKPLWAGLYALTARVVALIVAPRRARTNIYLTGSLAFGEPLYGLSDIDLVAVSTDETESRRVRRRYEALCRIVSPLGGLIPHFWTYDARSLARVFAGSYLVNGLAEGRAVFLGPDAVGDGAGLLLRPGLHGAPEWRRLRGRFRVVPIPTVQGRLHAAWLELRHRWRYALWACGEEDDVQRAALAVGLVADAARIWLWLAHGERHDGKKAPLKRALRLLPGEEDGLRYALDVHQAMHRSPVVAVEELLPCFVRISADVAGLVDEAAIRAGTTRVHLLRPEVGPRSADDIALLDWTALALPRLDPGLTDVVEERLVFVDDDPTDPAALIAAAGRGEIDRVPALRHGSLLIEPTHEVWGYGRLRLVQCRASDPVSATLLNGTDHAAFPELPGWSARDGARRAVAEHRAWLIAAPNSPQGPHKWMGPRPASVSTGSATLGLLLSAARSAVFLESIEEGSPTLPVRLSDVPAALAARDPGLGDDAAEAFAALDASRRELVSPPPGLVEHFRVRVESLPAYAPARKGPLAGDGARAPREELSRAC